MPFPPFFRRLFGDNPVKPYKIRKELLPLDVDAVETFRKSLIGCLIPTTMATLPSCLGIPDGSLFLFEDYPELKEKYDAGGFNGMLLESTASSEEKDAWRGKWIKHPQGLGLYSPRLSGLFLRNSGTAGRYNAHGLPNATGAMGSMLHVTGATVSGMCTKGVSQNALVNGTYSNTSLATYSVTLSNGNAIFGASSTVMPASADVVVGLYLGMTA